MIANYWILAVVTVLYICMCEVRADVKANKINKLEFWTREPNDARRLLNKKQVKNDKYPRTFQAIEDINNDILSYEEAHANDISNSKYDDRVNQLVSNEATKPSGMVWKSYVKEDKPKNTKEPTAKYTKKFEVSIIISKMNNNSAIKHFVKYPTDQEEAGTGGKVSDGSGIVSTPEPVAFMKRNILKLKPTEKAIERNADRKMLKPPIRQWSFKKANIRDKEEKTKVQSEYNKNDMFNKNYLMGNRLKDRNKIVIRV